MRFDAKSAVARVYHEQREDERGEEDRGKDNLWRVTMGQLC